MKDQTTDNENQKAQEITQVIVHEGPQKETEPSNPDEADVETKGKKSTISKPLIGVAIAGAGIAGLATGTVYSEKIKQEVGDIRSEIEGFVADFQRDEATETVGSQPLQSLPNPEILPVGEIPEIKVVPFSVHSDSHSISKAPTEMGISHTFEDGRVFQISFSDVDHDGKIDNWTASATDVTGNSQFVTGTGEQLTAIFLGQPSYAQQVDYVDEQTPIASMDDNFAPIDWPSAADETMQTIDAEMATEAEFQGQNADFESNNIEFVGPESPNFIGPVYEEQILEMEFDQMEVPESYSSDDFSTNDDFATAQFI